MTPLRHVAVALVSLALVAASCGSDSASNSGDAGLLPFDLVQENDFTFEADATDPGRGIFRVRTTEPMICAIVWGETAEFGSFNNSLAMNGTGIIDHDVALPGAEAGKTYFFRVQGTTADGNQYRSETGTFTIPALEGGGGDPSIDLGPNLALDATVLASSSSFGPGWEPENAIDGDTNTEWATRGDGDDGSITIDLGEAKEITAVEFLTRSMLDGTAITDTFTLIADGGEPLGPFPTGNPANPRIAELSFTGQVLTFEVETSTGGNVGAIEVRVYG